MILVLFNSSLSHCLISMIGFQTAERSTSPPLVMSLFLSGSVLCMSLKDFPTSIFVPFFSLCTYEICVNVRVVMSN
jgi:hypothetical protein